ncbi:TPA: hypothetical protein ACP7Q5_004985 [Escherichia coli]|jgi:hypothetical protein|nr:MULTISPECIES: hypothetical protein [Bacilli]ELG7158470.1 hypothetical protein [Staphylococcus aureus]HDH7443134.1 hypothetical protein [Escherichia coli]ELL1201580.1 hypothetical protein [Staphylococcus aureus]MDH9287382.1 hypothetical protein [Staphylococcus epidermidis]MDN3040676.1 hypothetical protein [Enterococcus faecium]
MSKELIEDFQNLTSLRSRWMELRSKAEMLLSEAADLDFRIRRASAVRAVVNGVPLSIPEDEIAEDGQDTQTVGNLDEDTRNTYVYKAVRSGGWVVRINGYSMTGREHFFGGKCLGLCLGWTQEKAREVALAWLTRSEIVEE